MSNVNILEGFGDDFTVYQDTVSTRIDSSLNKLGGDNGKKGTLVPGVIDTTGSVYGPENMPSLLQLSEMLDSPSTFTSDRKDLERLMNLLFPKRKLPGYGEEVESEYIDVYMP
mgnify:CR=1 FL=1